MVSIAFPLIIGIFISAIMLFTLYILPDVICRGISTRNSASINNILNDDPTLRDPLDGICYMLTNKHSWDKQSVRLFIILTSFSGTESVLLTLKWAITVLAGYLIPLDQSLL